MSEEKTTKIQRPKLIPDGFSWCPDCQSLKAIPDFRVWSTGKVADYCRSHMAARAAASYQRHKEKRSVYRSREDVKRKHRELERERRKSPKHKKMERERTIRRRPQMAAYARKNRTKIVANQMRRYNSDVSVRLGKRMSNSIYCALSGHKGQRTFGGIIIDYTVDDLKAHLERQFVKGMSWGNYGSHWHIDHIIPVSSFKITGPECPELRAAYSLANLRPLWSLDNMRKHANRTLLL